MTWYTYIVLCTDGSLYTGTAINISHRIALHNSGKGAKYTHSRGPVTLVFYEAYPDRSAACKREAEIKKLSRSEKEKLVQKNRASIDALPSQ